MSTHTLRVHTASLATQALGRRKSLHCALYLFSPQQSHSWCLKAVSNYSSREFNVLSWTLQEAGTHTYTHYVCNYGLEDK